VERSREEEVRPKEKIACALKQAEAGTPVAEVRRRMGISAQMFDGWKTLDGGLGSRCGGELAGTALYEPAHWARASSPSSSTGCGATGRSSASARRRRPRAAFDP
jgi:hypothetical protein